MQNTKKHFRVLSLLVLLALLVANAQFAVSCSDKTNTPSENVISETKDVGEGDRHFTLSVVDADGNTALFNVSTNAETVGKALIDLGIVKGDDGQYGLYIKEVNGIIADYDKDKTYWAFYEGDEYAMNGIESTEITEGASYKLAISK